MDLGAISVTSKCRAYLNAPQNTASRGGRTSSPSFLCPFHPAGNRACFELRRVDYEGLFHSRLDMGYAFPSHSPSSVEAPTTPETVLLACAVSLSPGTPRLHLQIMRHLEAIRSAQSRDHLSPATRLVSTRPPGLEFHPISSAGIEGRGTQTGYLYQ